MIEYRMAHIDPLIVKNWIKTECDPNNPAHRAALVRALGYVYANQTADEKASKDTKHLNGQGFNGREAGFLSSVYENAQKYGTITVRQAECLIKSLPKYARQIAEASEKEIV